jgi:eukaryotic-like serine/threonine-protein kinase
MKQCPKCSVRFQSSAARCPIDGEALVALQDPMIGRVIQERYLIEELIGTGGMGSVYRGSHQLLGRRVALKFLAPKLVRDPASRSRFLREARAVNRVQHEHIIDVHDVGETDDALVYMVMEHLSGRTLGDEIELGPLGLPRVCHIARQLAFALARAHELGVVHRDVKPGNVFLIRKGRDADFVKLLDFGLARAKDDVSITKSNLLFGTPEYMAPEQASAGTVGSKADLYALGCVVFEMLTGQLPFQGAPTGLIYKHVYEQPPRPSSLRPDTPAALEELTLRLLAKDPNKRGQNAYEIADELTRCAAALPQVVLRSEAPVAAAPESNAPPPRLEEDHWAGNVAALRARLLDLPASSATLAASAAVERAAELVDETRTLRRDLGRLTLSNARRHESARATMLRIGAALDTLALDEARAVHDCEVIKAERLADRERLEREVRRMLAAVHTFDPGRSEAPLAADKLLLVARDWAAVQERLLVLDQRWEEKEATRADLRFQISHLKGRLASLEAEAQAESEPEHHRAVELESEIGKKLAEIRDQASRVTNHLGRPKAG